MLQVGARLISHAGSLTNLAKYPASTVQILGAEKALFRYGNFEFYLPDVYKSGCHFIYLAHAIIYLIEII